MMKILCFGDSNTYGYDPRSYIGSQYGAESRWVDLLAAKTGHITVNRGMNGRCIPKDGIDFADADLALIMLGSNDLLQGASVETVTARMERFLTSLDIARTVLLAPPEMKEGEWVWKTALIRDSKALIESYKALAARLGAKFIDTAGWDIDLTFDGVHLSEKGHRIFAEKLASALENLI